MPKPSKLTPQLQEDICGYIANGLTFKDSCLLVDITEQTFISWRNRGAIDKSGKFYEFAEKVKQSEAKFKAVHLRNIRQAALGNPDSDGNRTDKLDWHASAWLLERKYHSEFPRQGLNIPSADQAPPQRIVIEVSQPDDDD